MDEQYKVSIIVPMYNAEKSIRRAVESLLCQDYYNIEIILVDDGSTDDTLDEVMAIAASDDRVRLIKKKHTGVSLTRNRGLNESTGDYIAFCDSDDYVDETYISSMLRYLDSDTDMVICKTNHFQRTDGQDGPLYYRLDKNYCKEWYISASEYASRGPVCKIFKRSIIRQHNIEFDETLCFGEDLLFVLNYMERCRRICLLNQIHYFISIRNDSLTRSITQAKIDSLLIAHKTYYEFLCRYGFNDRNNMKYYWLTLLEDYYINCIFIYSRLQNKNAKNLFYRFSRADIIIDAIIHIKDIRMSLHKKILIKCKSPWMWRLFVKLAGKRQR
ncbi:glycosyltransferase family 2 protein [Lachnotalea sp. AF33-28]|uniref:glycosyltransferase family 2 protein n=1 Tax=Lachnotalea sp. AF33-28 TaxID=2292046 RepID=UPI000E50560B|nr:glycosyltransferase family A protein [Lachnotalea sp. AF33-28]RHP35452.1 glycosyltransferase family 2 protein [Lachnotalea sp. AF33-28]